MARSEYFFINYVSVAIRLQKRFYLTGLRFLFCVRLSIFTTPARAVAKYCDDYVCVSACRRGYLRNHTRDLYQFLCMLPIAMARSFSGRVTKSQGEGEFWGFSCPFTMHCTA